MDLIHCQHVIKGYVRSYWTCQLYSILIDGAITRPNIELNKCSGQASKQVIVVEVMINHL
jgi:hypothetical protein